jgi:hypothetical protein
VQDGFELYLHGFFVTKEGDWTVVQQGMNGDRKLARRYHWLSEGLESFVEEPHAAIEGEPVGEIVNLVDARARASRSAQVELIKEGPDRILAEVVRLEPPRERSPQLRLPIRHHLTSKDVVLKRLHAALAAAHERAPIDFADVLATPGVGARTLLSLALVAEVLHGTPSRFSDPARFSLAHGGKDGHPYPVPLKVYDRTIQVMKRAVDAARIGRSDRLFAIRRLDEEARKIERTAKRLEGPRFDDFVASERARSHEYGGKTVFGDAEPPPESIPAKRVAP